MFNWIVNKPLHLGVVAVEKGALGRFWLYAANLFI